MPMSWLEIQNRIQHVSTGVSCLLNAILIVLILKFSPKKIGTYKFLMVYISVFQVVYSVMDVVSLPVYHTVGSVFVVFKDIRDKDYLAWTVHFALLVTYAGCYGFSMAIFGIHFYYRHLAISGEKSLQTFKGAKLAMWLLIPPTFALIWALTAAITFRPTEETDAEIGSSILESYDLKLSEIVYIAAFIWPKDRVTGEKYLNMRPALGIAIEELIVISSLTAIFYFGFCCYHKIRRHVKSVASASRLTKNLHRQLFYALVMQTAIPIMLLHVPVSGLFMFPMLDQDLGFFTGFVTITIAVYPAIDPLPTMFIVENYRNAIFAFFAFPFQCKQRSENSNGAASKSVSFISS